MNECGKKGLAANMGNHWLPLSAALAQIVFFRHYDPSDFIRRWAEGFDETVSAKLCHVVLLFGDLAGFWPEDRPVFYSDAWPLSSSSRSWLIASSKSA